MFFMFKLLKSIFNTFLVGGDSPGGRQYFDIKFRFSKRDLPHLPTSPFWDGLWEYIFFIQPQNAIVQRVRLLQLVLYSDLNNKTMTSTAGLKISQSANK